MRYRDYVPLFTEAESPHMRVLCTSCDVFLAKGERDNHVYTAHRTSYDEGRIIELNGIWWRKRGT